ncbi:MAG: GMC family oxidoreductase [Polyangiaceae bacterium]
MSNDKVYDVVIVGAGACGSVLANQLAAEGKKVLVLDAGDAIPDDRSPYMENFFMARAKTPESPYPTTEPRGPKQLFPLPNPSTLATPRPTILQLSQWRDPKQSYLVQPQTPKDPAPDPKTGELRQMPFASTYERVAGGTMWHWLGTSLRHVPHDLTMYSTYGKGVPNSPFDPNSDWPITYTELQGLYGQAESEIGVSASVAEQAPLKDAIGLTYPTGYEYPLPPIPTSLVDDTVSAGLGTYSVGSGVPQDPNRYPVFVSPTPAGRNSVPYQGRRVCAGNTNCIPICPIQAKWDPTVSMNNALNTGNVDIIYHAVACNVVLGSDGKNVAGIDYLTYDKGDAPGTPKRATARGKAYVLAAHAIENAKLLLMSNNGKGIANTSGQVGQNLMDHVIYLSWAIMPPGKPSIFGYRGPLATAGIESLRDGAFRKYRCAFRIEIGNEGWNFPEGDPYNTTTDLVLGTNQAGLNPKSERLGGAELALRLNQLFTRQFRLGFLMEQTPQAKNRVILDTTNLDGLGLPRPKIIDYGLDEYTLNGFRAARQIASEIYAKVGAEEHTDFSSQTQEPGYFVLDGKPCRYYGAGHVVGTHRMGTNGAHAVVDASQRSFDHPNLWVVGSGSFPTIATANPTLTLIALAFKSASSILSSLSTLN